MDLTFEWFGFSSPQMAAALDIRTRVFVDEQGYTLEEDRDEQDKTCLLYTSDVYKRQGGICGRD